MGELKVDVAGVRAAAHGVLSAVDGLTELGCSTWDPGDLPGSAVGGIAAPAAFAGRLADIVANLHAWATAAQASAADFERAEAGSVDRLDHR
jgi:hypothetical protein